MRLHKTGHPIADTISDIVGELPNGDYNICYGILRHSLFHGDRRWFEIDKGFWGSDHYTGNYRIALNGTQPIYNPDGLFESHPFKPADYLRYPENLWTMICPPTEYVCAFFDIDYSQWMFEAINKAKNYGLRYMLRTKEAETPIEWEKVGRVITFNSTIGITALLCGIPVDSDPVHSTIGSWNNSVDAGDRDKLFSFCAAHQFKLEQKDKLIKIIEHYI